jgi:flagellar biogenesis protein FliO
VLETMAFIFAPPIVLLIIGVAVWLIIRLLSRAVAARQTG